MMLFITHLCVTILFTAVMILIGLRINRIAENNMQERKNFLMSLTHKHINRPEIIHHLKLETGV